ncbi:2'-5' RNA ligase [Cenarchaeum symbiosum A]|uniref:RNA 2',3'-cyclic phosphodiesterase n=1 Tax=Cenarchaeum symbiosum (strain A) TaxID=414004 RepID=A0RYQ5_CENSY|nr:2'-5' RNA ligase [Cenarchaeum symbiosum A]
MRSFVAVEVTDAGALERIASVQRCLAGWGRQVGAENLHFTLAFLGEIDDAAAAAAGRALGSVSFEPFTVLFRGVGAFPSAKSPRVVWAGVDEKGGGALAALARTVCSALGVSPDIRGRPHLTMLRIGARKDMRDALGGLGGEELGSQRVDHVKLKKSVLTRQGPVYSDLAEVGAA